MRKDVFFPRVGAREMKSSADRTQRDRKLEIWVLKIFFVDWNDKRNLTHHQLGLPTVFFLLYYIWFGKEIILWHGNIENIYHTPCLMQKRE